MGEVWKERCCRLDVEFLTCFCGNGKGTVEISYMIGRQCTQRCRDETRDSRDRSEGGSKIAKAVALEFSDRKIWL